MIVLAQELRKERLNPHENLLISGKSALCTHVNRSRVKLVTVTLLCIIVYYIVQLVTFIVGVHWLVSYQGREMRLHTISYTLPLLHTISCFLSTNLNMRLILPTIC